MWFQLPFEMPEEIRKQMEEHQQRAEMAADSYRHDVTRLFAELPLDQLMTLRNMLHQLVFDEDGRLAAYYEGQVSSALRFVHNVCPSCGVDHDKEAANFEPAPAEDTEANMADDLIGEYRQKAAEKADEEPPTDKLQSMLPTFDLTEEDLANMEKYHLDDMRDQDTHQILGFLCTGVGNQGACGMIYPSIEDRMMRDPETCTGCQQRAAWG